MNGCAISSPAAAASTQALAAACRPFVSCGLRAPASGEACDCGSGFPELRLSLAAGLFRGLRFQRVGGYDLSHCDAALLGGGGGGGPGRLARLPAGGAPPGGHAPALIRPGALVLPDIRARLARAGLECDLVEGGLVTRAGGVILQRAKAGGGLELEGPACPEYYRVREALYEAYALV